MNINSYVHSSAAAGGTAVNSTVVILGASGGSPAAAAGSIVARSIVARKRHASERIIKRVCRGRHPVDNSALHPAIPFHPTLLMQRASHTTGLVGRLHAAHAG